MAAGAPRKTDERAEVVAAEGRLVEMMNRVKPLTVKDDVLQLMTTQCSAMRTDREQLGELRALVVAMTADWNPYRVTDTFFERLSETKEWPVSVGPIRPGTIANFRQGDSVPQARSLVAILFACHLMEWRRQRHPCFRDLVTKWLARSNAPLKTFRFELPNMMPGAPNSRLARIAAGGRQLYDFLSLEPGEINEARLKTLLDYDLFNNLETDDGKAGPYSLTAIRLDVDDDTYLASRLDFERIPAEFRGEHFAFVQTYMRLENGGESVRSHGFLVPQSQDAYIVQHHKDGAGVNVISLPMATLGDRMREFWGGLILAVDRQRSSGALCSRIVLFRPIPDLPLLGSIKRADLLHRLEKVGRRNFAERVIAYLHPDQKIGVAPFMKPDELDEQMMTTWQYLDRFITTESVSAHLHKRGNFDLIYGFSMGPLRA